MAVLVVGFFPVVQYRLGVTVPGFPYKPAGVQACEGEFGRGTNNTNQVAYNQCLQQYIWQPIYITGSASLAYRFLGVGVSPFPALMTVSEDSFHAILHLSGTDIVAAEEVPQAEVLYNPPGIGIDNRSLSVGFLGQSNVTISFANGSGQNITDASVLLSVPGESGNWTDSSGVKWMFSSGVTEYYDQTSLCLLGGHPQNVTPGGSCTVTQNPTIDTSRGSTFRYSAEVRGYLGDRYFVSEKTFSYTLPAQAIDKAWVTRFISTVDSARNGSALLESKTLDRFAALRFSTAVTQPDISDYGLTADISTFFGANRTQPVIVEVLLYPAGQDPYSYIAYIQGSAPGHWSALTDKNYTHFGFFVATGTYETVKLPCSVTEIPRAGVNITQFFNAAGCSVSPTNTTWLVLILSK